MEKEKEMEEKKEKEERREKEGLIIQHMYNIE